MWCYSMLCLCTTEKWWCTCCSHFRKRCTRLQAPWGWRQAQWCLLCLVQCWTGNCFNEFTEYTMQSSFLVSFENSVVIVFRHCYRPEAQIPVNLSVSYIFWTPCKWEMSSLFIWVSAQALKYQKRILYKRAPLTLHLLFILSYIQLPAFKGFYLIFYGKQLCLNLAVRVEKTLKYLVLFLNRFIKKFRSF